MLVVLVACVVRLPMWLGYSPALSPDSGTYVQAAQDLASGDFSVGQGRRTPGYPLLIAAVDGDLERVVALQLLGGVVATILIYLMTVHLTRHSGWATAAATAHALNLQQLFAEGLVLTEAMSALTVIAALAALIAACARVPNRFSASWGIGLVLVSLLSAFALFVRPQFVCLLAIAPLAIAWATLRARGTAGPALAAGSLVLIPAVVLVVGWAAVQKEKVGYFVLSTQSGFGLVNHAIDFIELAPDEFTPAREVLRQVRDRRIAEVGHSRNTIWYAWPEIRQVTGWSLPEASRQMQAMCRRMFVEHPWLYARSVASAWVDFWTVPIFWEPEQVHPPALRSAIEGAWWVQHKLLRLANLAFVLVVAAAAVWPAFRRRVRWDIGLSAIAATVLMSSLIQALADQGASSRYHLPTQSLVVLVLAVVAARWSQRSSGVPRAPHRSAAPGRSGLEGSGGVGS